jgi:hypothetical protein
MDWFYAFLNCLFINYNVTSLSLILEIESIAKYDWKKKNNKKSLSVLNVHLKWFNKQIFGRTGIKYLTTCREFHKIGYFSVSFINTIPSDKFMTLFLLYPHDKRFQTALT